MQLPAFDTDADKGYTETANYLIWAFITYQDPATGSLVVGGTSTTIHPIVS